MADTLVVDDVHNSTRPTDWAGSLGRWLIFAAGLAVLVIALILPAQRDLRSAQYHRDMALHIEQSHHTRIDRYESFLSEMENPAMATIELLAMSQLGMIASNRQALIVPGQPDDPQLFEFLEPAPKAFAPQALSTSRLETISKGSRSKWLFALVGAAAVMYGLLPAAKP